MCSPLPIFPFGLGTPSAAKADRRLFYFSLLASSSKLNKASARGARDVRYGGEGSYDEVV
jgi:hypothetical protein